MKPTTTGLLIAIFALGLGGTLAQTNPNPGKLERLTPRSASGPINVVTTTNFVTDLVEQVGGDRVKVTGLMGPGVDPHLYKASAGDVRALQRAEQTLQQRRRVGLRWPG